MTVPIYRFTQILSGPALITLASGFSRLSACEAHALDWFAETGHALVYRERDQDNSAIDFMMEKRGELYQFACEPDTSTPAELTK